MEKLRLRQGLRFTLGPGQTGHRVRAVLWVAEQAKLCKGASTVPPLWLGTLTSLHPRRERQEAGKQIQTDVSSYLQGIQSKTPSRGQKPE